MKANEAPEKIYIFENPILDFTKLSVRQSDTDIEYIRTDVFIDKAKKWFEQQPETYDANGVRVYGEEDFEDFRKHMEGE